MKDSIINLPNGLRIITWQEDGEVYMSVVNNNGAVITDRKLTVSEAVNLSLTTNCP